MASNIDNAKYVCEYKQSAAKPIIVLLITYVITTMLQGAISSFPINRLIGFALVVLLFYEWFSTKRSHLAYLAMLLLVLVSLHSLLSMTDFSQELTDWVYLTSTMLIMSLAASEQTRTRLYNELVQLKPYIILTVGFSTVLLSVLLVTRNGYVVAWGEGMYFKGLCNTEHTLASICTLLLVLVVFLARTGSPKIMCIFSLLVVLYALLETGARTYLVPAAICSLLLIDEIAKYKWIKIALTGVLVIVGTLVFLSSGMASKFEFAHGNIYANSLLSAVTNGRNEIWLTDLSAWANSGHVGIMLGNSFSKIYELNNSSLTLPIWAHNDFVMVLYGTGIVGFSVYVGSLISLFRSMKQSVKWGTFLLLFTFVIFPLCLNGFFPYQHLVYAFLLLYVTRFHDDSSRKDINV